MATQEIDLFPPECRALREAGWPDHLIKATCDPFHYAMGLRGGMVLEFESAEPQANGLFVRLHRAEEGSRVGRGHFPFNTDRGLDVRVSEIVWVLDAPHGS